MFLYLFTVFQCAAPNCTTQGSRYRNIQCVVNGSSGVHVDNTKCNHLIKPETVEDCYMTEDCTPEWVTLRWGNVILSCSVVSVLILTFMQCTKSCNGGIRTRGLMCKLGDKEVSETLCTADKPSTFQQCNTEVPCPSLCMPRTTICKRIKDSYCGSQLVSGDVCKSSCCKKCTRDQCI